MAHRPQPASTGLVLSCQALALPPGHLTGHWPESSRKQWHIAMRIFSFLCFEEELNSMHVCYCKPRPLFENVHFSTPSTLWNKLALQRTLLRVWRFSGPRAQGTDGASCPVREHETPVTTPSKMRAWSRARGGPGNAIAGLPSASLTLGEKGSVLRRVGGASGFTCCPTGSRGPPHRLRGLPRLEASRAKLVPSDL